MKLWLLRHARVQLPDGLCYGGSDVPADPDLTLDAARHWTARLPVGAIWRVSALGRAQQLADALMRGITRYFAKNPPLARSRSV